MKIREGQAGRTPSANPKVTRLPELSEMGIFTTQQAHNEIKTWEVDLFYRFKWPYEAGTEKESKRMGSKTDTEMDANAD